MKKVMSDGHGNVQIEWHDNVMVANIFGPFNESGTQASLAKIRHDVEVFKANNRQSKWARIDILSEDSFGSPEVMTMIADGYIWASINGCVGIACVCANTMQQSMLADFQRRTGLNIFHQSSQKEALIWCQEQLQVCV